MRRSRIKQYGHLVWATKHREPRITEEWERRVYHCITAQAQSCGCTVRAIGGMPDHVHVVLWYPATQDISTVVKKMKGISSAMLNDLQNHEHHFRWQENYALFSISPWDVDKVVGYVQNQKQHHAEGTTRDILEQTDEEAPDPNAPKEEQQP